MSNRSLGARVQEQLTQAVASGRLPAVAQDRAEKLLDRINKPVRVGLMGLPGSGKSTLVNLLVGTVAVPPNTRFPTLELTFGETESATITLPDGTRQELDKANGKEIASMSPAFVEMRLPLAALGKISVLEVVTPEDTAALQRASQWAAGRIDVALWCTQAYNEVEQAIWAQMPDILKDHAFLMLTKADFLIGNDMLDKTMDRIRGVADDEFSQILPIATKQAIAARRPNGTVDKELMRSSGGTALISAVLKQVDMGRQTAVDMADILLHQHAETLAAPPEEKQPKPKVAVAVPGVAREEEDEEILQTLPDDAPVEAPVETAPVLVAVEATAPEPEAKVLHAETRTAFTDAVTYINDQAKALSALLEEQGDAAPSAIIGETVEHVQWLSDHFNDNGHDDDAALQDIRNSAMDAADLVQLMQMEKRDSAAVEAVCLLLQLKHELQADLAA